MSTAPGGAWSRSGGTLLTATIRASGLDRALSAALARWREPAAVHDPAKVVLDLAVALGLGGDCLADIAVLRAEPGVFGLVASDPTVSRTIDALAADAPAALKAIHAARAAARRRVWGLAGQHAPDAGITAASPLVIDLDATLVTAHSDKELARPTFKRGYGHHPLWAFADHGAEGTGEPLAVMLRAGNAGSNTAADHVSVIREALRQLPSRTAGTSRRAGRKVLIRIDGAGATHDVVNYIAARRMSYSVGFPLPDNAPELLKLIPDSAWSPAYDSDGQVRDGAWVAELTGLLELDKEQMARGHAGHRPQGTAASRSAAADHRRRRPPRHRVRHEHPPGRPGHPAAGPGAAPPQARPVRGPDPQREGHRTGQPPAARLRPEPDLVRGRSAGLRDHRLDADARPARPPGPQMGTQATAPAAALDRRPPATRSRTRTLHLSAHAPWTTLTIRALNRLKASTTTPAPSG